MENSLIRRAAARRELTLRQARREFAAFVSQVFGFELAAHHQRWIEAVEQHDRVVLLAPIEHGKTTIVSVAYPLFVLGRNPAARIAIVSETFSQAARPLAAIREQIAGNARLHEIFPNLKPARGSREKWSDAEIVVARSVASKDPSVLAVGVLGPLLGTRLDLAILDDVCSWENSMTVGQQAK